MIGNQTNVRGVAFMVARETDEIGTIGQQLSEL